MEDIKEKHTSNSAMVGNVSYLQCSTTLGKVKGKTFLKWCYTEETCPPKSPREYWGEIKTNSKRVIGGPSAQSSTDDIFNASKMRSLVENQCVSEGKEPTELKLLPVTAGLREPAESSWASPQLCVLTEDHLLTQHGLKGLLPGTAWPRDRGATGSSHIIQKCLHGDGC